LGRTLNAEDDRPEKPAVAAIEYNYWKRRFALDPAVIGKTIRLNRKSFIIVGVTPRGFCGISVTVDRAESTYRRLYGASLS
jgi:hypothetical protein